MDLLLAPSVRPNGTNIQDAVCYSTTSATSAGLWLGDSPLAYSLPRMMAAMSLIFTVESVTHFVLRRFGQSKVVSQIVAGGILGFSGMARNKDFASLLFPPQSKLQFDVLCTVGVMFFLFMIGVKTDLRTLGKSGRKAVVIGLVGTVLPLCLMALAAYLLRNAMPPELMAGDFIYHLAAAWSRTSYTVLSCVLAELHLLNSKLGRIAMTATLVSELNNTVVTSISTTIQLGYNAKSQVMALGSFASFMVLLAFVLLVARPTALWIIRRTPQGDHIKEGYLLLIIILVLVCGLAGEVIGHHAATGTFILGLALPGGPPLGSTLQDRLDTMVSSVLVPLFMAGAGFRTTIFSLVDRARCLWVFFFIMLGTVGKTLGVLVPAWFCRVPTRDAATLALMMNTKGIFEVYTLNIWKDTSMVDTQVYTVILICVVAFSSITSFMVKTLYKPNMGYLVYKRRTVQNARRDAELRVLACLHSQKDVAPMVDLFQISSYATRENPICLYVLHVVPLLGHAAAMISPYRKQQKGSTSGCFSIGVTDRIMNAFRMFELDSKGGVLVLPYIAISPQATMHADVCALALEKKVSLVVLPFHKRMAIDGTLKTLGAPKNMNVNVLSYAPCSVGIFIDHGHAAGGAQFLPGKQVVHRVALYFLGGADDREALALATRVMENPAVGLTVIRLLLPKEWRRHGPEEALDEEAVSEFRLGAMDNVRVAYQEEVVRDGEGAIEVIRATSSRFTLLVVGRRCGLESPLTEGLSIWSENPELGVIGDMLASTDIAGNVSTLVVQQQAWMGAPRCDAAPDCDISFPPMYSKRITPT